MIVMQLSDRRRPERLKVCKAAPGCAIDSATIIAQGDAQGTQEGQQAASGAWRVEDRYAASGARDGRSISDGA